MYKLNQTRRTFDDCKWFGVDEPRTPEEIEATKEALKRAVERHQRRMDNQSQYGKKHWGGEDY